LTNQHRRHPRRRNRGPAIHPAEVEADTLRGDRLLRTQVDPDSMDWLNFLLGLHEMLSVEIPEADYAKLVMIDDEVA